ncbi:MAG: helix-turn-helix transcriptional regulator [Chitinophagaceae bacterium]|nr:helix-turn-helix transcriptional regulator [Chitinophagaceae bacterium]
MDDKHNDIDTLLNGIFKSESLRERFERRLHNLKMSQTGAEKLMKIARRTLNGILDGTQKRADLKNLKKVATFLNMSVDKLIELHSAMAEKNFEYQSTPTNNKRFIKSNFDLAALRKAGFIENISDFKSIEEKIVSFFGFGSIFEYKKRAFDTAFSAGALALRTMNNADPETTSHNCLITDFWLTSAKSLATRIDNPYQYNRQKLIDFFPQIRWYSRNEEFGFVNVIKELYRLGVTVVFLPRFSNLHIRGATFAVDNKPCIALTDYRGFYPTLWHCLIHELYHTLFDWIEILNDAYSFHVSDATEEVLTLNEKEIEADEFAQKYLFSEEKMEDIKLFIYDRRYIEEIARDNNVHPSIIHSYYAHANAKTDRMAWVRARRFMPEITKSVFPVANSWNTDKTLDEIAKKLKLEIYN